jgi:hypothetical protein
VAIELALECADDGRLRADLLSEILEGDRGVVPVELGGGPRHFHPARRLPHGIGRRHALFRANERREPLGRDAGESPRVPVALEDDEVVAPALGVHSVVDGRHQLAGELACARLVTTDLVAEPLADTNPAVERGGGILGELERDERAGVDEWHPGEAECVDLIRLRVALEELPQVRSLRGRDPVDDMSPADEEDRDGQPRHPGRLDDDRRALALAGSVECSPLECLEQL